MIVWLLSTFYTAIAGIAASELKINYPLGDFVEILGGQSCAFAG